MENSKDTLQFATLGGGCFWCLEAVFQDLKGVQKVISGYTGGNINNPSYKEICSGLTGHAEVVQITFDPEIIKYEELLEIFWATHDPTTLNRQGNDVGTQYRSEIFYHNTAQQQIASSSIKNVATTMHDKPIVTQLSKIQTFFPATEEHQNFYKLNPNYGYCRVIIDPKVNKVRQKYADRLQ